MTPKPSDNQFFLAKAIQFVKDHPFIVALMTTAFGGFGIFIITLLFFSNSDDSNNSVSTSTVIVTSTTVPSSPSIQASSSGDQSQVIVVTGDNTGGVTINQTYGVPSRSSIPCKKSWKKRKFSWLTEKGNSKN